MNFAKQAWRKPAATIAAAVSAAVLPTLIVSALVFAIAKDEITSEEWWVVVATLFVFAFAHVLLLGLPIAQWLRRKGRLHALPVATTGLFVGALPYGLFALFFDSSDAGFTLDAWIDWLQETAVFAVFGLLGAMAFYCVYRAIAGGITTQAASSD